MVVDVYNVPKIYSPQEVPDDHPLKRMRYYPCDGSVLDRLKIEFRKFSVGGSLRGYAENRFSIDYVKVTRVTRKSIYLKVYYAPRREVYRGFTLEYSFKVLHVFGGCVGDYIYIYTYVAKNVFGMNYSGTWWREDNNYEIVVYRINYKTGEIDSESFSNTVPEAGEGMDYIDYSRYVSKLWERAFEKFIKDVVGLGKKYGVVVPEKFDPFYLGSFYNEDIKVRGKFGNVEVNFLLWGSSEAVGRIYEARVYNRLLSRFVRLLDVFNMLKEVLQLDKAVLGKVEIGDGESIKYEYKIVFGGRDEFMAVYKGLTLQFPSIVSNAYNVYLKGYVDEGVLSSVLSFHFKQAGYDEYSHVVDVIVKLVRKCPPVGRGYVVYVKKGLVGVHGKSSCGFFRISAKSLDEFVKKVAEYV